MITLKPFGTLNAIVLTKSRQVFFGIKSLVLFEVFGVFNIGNDLIEVAQVSSGFGACLLVWHTHFENRYDTVVNMAILSSIYDR